MPNAHWLTAPSTCGEICTDSGRYSSCILAFFERDKNLHMSSPKDQRHTILRVEDTESNQAKCQRLTLLKRSTMVLQRRTHVLAFLALASRAAGWNIALPKAASNPSSSRSAYKSVETAVACRRPCGGRQSQRLPVLPGNFWMASGETFRLASSSSETAAQESSSEESVNGEDEVETRPFPKVGDVVRYEGKWEGDVSFGEIRQLRRVDETGEWRAYILGLEDIGEGQYGRKKNRKSKAEDITTLRPVRAFYVRSVDGFKVMRDSITGEPRYISDAYELENFELPKIEVDPVKFAADLESYEDLKRRLVVDAASFGAVGAFVAFQLFGADRGLLFALGAFASVGYVVLLEKTADDVASGKQDVATKLKGDLRFGMPVLLVAAIALRNYLSHPETAQLLNLIPKDDFAAAMVGFIAPSRLPLLYREIRSSLKGDEILDMLPGSLGQGRQILRSMADSNGAEAPAEAQPRTRATRIIVVSGPNCLGKTTLVKKIMAEDSRLAVPTWCTTRPLRTSEVDGEDANFVKQVKFEELERNGDFLQTYKDDGGESYGLRLEDLLDVAEKGKVCVVDADRPLVTALMGVGEVDLIGVWVSLDSIEAIESRIRATLMSKDGVSADSPELESDLRGLVRQAVDDIEFGVMSGVFDFTVINNSDEEESMETVRRAVEFAKS